MRCWAVLLCCCAATALAAVEVTNADGQVRCRWPGDTAPTLRTVAEASTQGPLNISMLCNEVSGRGWLLAWHEQPPLADATPDEVPGLLAAGARALAKRMQGEVTASTPGDWAGVPAISFTIAIPVSDDLPARVAVGRLLLRHRRCYQQVCLGLPGEDAAAVQQAAADFLASLELIAAPAQSPAASSPAPATSSP